MDNFLKIRLLTLGLLLVATALIWSAEITDIEGLNLSSSLSESWFGQGICPEEKLCVAFLDVGQGDSIFIQSPSGQQMLIDGGRGSAVLRELGKVMGDFDRNLDYVLMTHPDADHIGGLVDIFERYEIGAVIKTTNQSESAVFASVMDLIKDEEADEYLARRGQRYDLGEGVIFEVLFPDVETSNMESNASSIVGRLTYGTSSFLLTGDSPKSIEEYLVLVDGEYLQSDVLKVGHHGSRTSTAEMFLAEVQPEYAIISVGKDSQYGHPHVEVTDMLFNAGVQTLSTAEEGTIVFVSDSTSLEVLK